MEYAGTPQYMAPEILAMKSKKGHYDERADTWSVAVLAYELVTGNLPFPSEHKEKVIKQ